MNLHDHTIVLHDAEAFPDLEDRIRANDALCASMEHEFPGIVLERTREKLEHPTITLLTPMRFRRNLIENTAARLRSEAAAAGVTP